MDVFERIEDLRRAVGRQRAAGRTVALVPTMGALHEGHYSLIDAAVAACDSVVVSIFVNPTQFGPNEDLASYPRTLEADLAGCEARGVDAAFAPSAETMYAADAATKVTVDRLAATLCGRSRPGHFDGVCTVVAKLFNIAQPDKAFFGQKDFQQAMVVRKMAGDLNFPVEVVVCPTIREADGVAMSTRNVYLTAGQRRQAAALHGALQFAAEMIRRDRPPAERVIAAIRDRLTARAPDGEIDYVQIVDPERLCDVETTERPVLVALAVRFGRARLIDNTLVDAAKGEV